jgi:murein DD-endopeptidase MepM/ murein hydrolase activator NlpD
MHRLRVARVRRGRAGRVAAIFVNALCSVVMIAAPPWPTEAPHAAHAPGPPVRAATSTFALAPVSGTAGWEPVIVPNPTRAPAWVWPVPTPIRVLAPFRAPLHRYAEGHRGIDLAVEPGAELVAAGPGVVRFVGWVGDRSLVSIDHGDGVISSIEPVDAGVAKGDVLARGAPIGRLAVGGHCADGCAHFGVRVHGEYVSPLLFLGGVPRAALLPLVG